MSAPDDASNPDASTSGSESPDKNAPEQAELQKAELQRATTSVAPLSAKARRAFFTKIALAGSNELRSHLQLDEINYLRLALEAQSDARAYFMYSVLDTVYEAGVAMMRWEDLLAGEEEDNDSGGSIEDRLVSESLVAEMSLWIRRLLEALATLICFATTNENIYYRHWLFIDQLGAFNYVRKDRRDYFACESKGLAHRIDETIAEIRKMEPSLDFARCWYLRDKRALPAVPHASLLASFGEILRTAISLARPREKAELGLSYQQFSRVSRSIHFSPGNKWYERSDAEFVSYFSYCSLLVQSTLIRVIELNSMTPTGLCAQLMRVYDANSAPDEQSLRMTSGRAKVDDFVVVGRGLARVTAVKNSPYGYESYTVRFLADAPSPSVSVDDVLPYHIRRLHDTAKIRARVLDLMKEVAPNSGLTDEKRQQNIEESIEDAVKETWERGLRDSLFLSPGGLPKHKP